jgi:hypothetical protein
MGNEHGKLAVEANTLADIDSKALAELIQWLRAELLDLDVAARWVR